MYRVEKLSKNFRINLFIYNLKKLGQWMYWMIETNVKYIYHCVIWKSRKSKERSMHGSIKVAVAGQYLKVEWRIIFQCPIHGIRNIGSRTEIFAFLIFRLQVLIFPSRTYFLLDSWNVTRSVADTILFPKSFFWCCNSTSFLNIS